tara:strand:+ start:715 stop:1071 length:357 start_codon:yes stop_codon:yes gene_type:complete
MKNWKSLNQPIYVQRTRVWLILCILFELTVFISAFSTSYENLLFLSHESLGSFFTIFIALSAGAIWFLIWFFLSPAYKQHKLMETMELDYDLKSFVIPSIIAASIVMPLRIAIALLPD